ncbi:hypothetical protein D3C80_1039350 [compost metagenome]
MLLRFQQRFPRHDVVLHVPTLVVLKEGAQHQHQFFSIPRILQRRRVQFLIQQHAAEDRRGGQFGQRIEHGGRSQMIGTGGRAGTFRQRRMRFTAVWRGQGSRAKGHVS